MKEHVFASFVIHTCNEAEYIANTIRHSDKLLEDSFDGHEIIIVNNCSNDNTKEIIEQIKEYIHGNLILIDLAWKHSVESALFAGLDLAVGDFVFETESAKFIFPDDIFVNMYKKASKENLHLVSAISGLKPSLSSRLFYRFINKVSYISMDVKHDEMRLISRTALNKTLALKHKVRFRKILYAYSAVNTGEIYFKPRSNKRLKDSRGMLEKLNIGSDILISFSHIGMQLSLLLSIIFFFLFLLLILYSLYSYFILKDAVEGWTTLMIIISSGFSGVFLLIALLSKYLGIILLETRDQQIYTIKDIKRYEKNR